MSSEPDIQDWQGELWDLDSAVKPEVTADRPFELVTDLEPRIRDLATRYIDAFIEQGECDFIDAFAGRLPMDVISEMLGVPESDRDELRAWADAMVHREEGVFDVPPETYRQHFTRLHA